MVRDEVYTGEDGDLPVSRAEQFMKAHPDITVLQTPFFGIEIFQLFQDKWRYLKVDIEQEKGSQRHYPAVIVKAFDYSIKHSITEDVVMNIRRHALTTLVKVHTENDEQVTTEVGYEQRLRYPSDFSNHYIRWLEKYSLPLPAQELIATARTGLGMLKAYREASCEQRERIDNTLTGLGGWHGSQIVDGTRPDMDAYIAEASPLLGSVMRREGISYTHVGTRSIYALNALNKVTDAMLPAEMPPAPKNRREPRRKATPERAAQLPAPRRG